MKRRTPTDNDTSDNASLGADDGALAKTPAAPWNSPTSEDSNSGQSPRQSSDPSKLIGQRLGNYRIIKRLGHGGMGVVYLAEHQMLGSSAVVKLLHPDLSAQKDVVDRFFNEAKAATRIKHPGIVQVFDFGIHEESGSAFIAMELLEGETLSARIARMQRMPASAAAAIARQVASALGAAHKAGIVHRDLKPDNLFLISDPDMPDGERVKVLDFGIAKLIEAEPTRRTRTGDVFGTPLYMSPEQCRNAGNVDARTDVYALGCILYEMLVGHPPFVNQGLTQLITAHMFEAPRPPRSLVPAISDSIERVVLRALAKEPQDRQATMREFATELDDILGRRMQTPLPFPLEEQIAGAVPRGLVSTTLGRSAGQIDVIRQGPRRFWPIMGIMVMLATVFTLVIVKRGGDRSSPRPTKPTLASHAATEHQVVIEPITTPPPTTDTNGSAAASAPPPVTPPKPAGSKQRVPPHVAATRSGSALGSAAVADGSAATSIAPASAVSLPPTPMGVLSLGSKPPCAIYVDGQALHLQTPQPEIKLAPGPHNITLVNTEYGIKDTFSIDIAAGEHVRTSKDFSDKLKREAPSSDSTIDPFKTK